MSDFAKAALSTNANAAFLLGFSDHLATGSQCAVSTFLLYEIGYLLVFLNSNEITTLGTYMIELLSFKHSSFLPAPNNSRKLTIRACLHLYLDSSKEDGHYTNCLFSEL